MTGSEAAAYLGDGLDPEPVAVGLVRPKQVETPGFRVQLKGVLVPGVGGTTCGREELEGGGREGHRDEEEKKGDEMVEEGKEGKEEVRQEEKEEEK